VNSVQGEPKLVSSIALSFRPDGQLVSAASLFIRRLYDSVLRDPDEASRVALAAHELMENSVQHSSDGVCYLGVEHLNREGQEIIRITLRNRAIPERLLDLRRILDQIRDCVDPIALYHEFIVQTADREQGSGLGLVRILAEAKMDIRYTIAGDEVTLVVEMPVKGKRSTL
jgi:two-component sensor histidine kinase